eukprot:46153-Eustigmatos_ZCMA.PRE.1
MPRWCSSLSILDPVLRIGACIRLDGARQLRSTGFVYAWVFVGRKMAHMYLSPAPLLLSLFYPAAMIRQ